jgi:enoyl-CoA hydratase/carnithine racemase
LSGTAPLLKTTERRRMYEQILYEVTDPVATITLNRPQAVNAWTTRMGAKVKHAIALPRRTRASAA